MKYRIKRGDIYLASYHFPHENETIIRQRPVLVLQCDEDNENPHYPLVIVAPVTTQKIERIYEQDVFLTKGEGGLVVKFLNSYRVVAECQFSHSVLGEN